MRTLMILPALAALALAGCQSNNETNTSTDVEAVAVDNDMAEAGAVGNEAEGENALARVLAMSDRERNVVFIRAILDAGMPCQEVTGSSRLPDQDGHPLWRADCAGGASHMISITPDGTANIISRTGR